jgi:hypothetical protein
MRRASLQGTGDLGRSQASDAVTKERKPLRLTSCPAGGPGAAAPETQITSVLVRQDASLALKGNGSLMTARTSPLAVAEGGRETVRQKLLQAA